MSTFWENWGIGTTLDDHTGALLRTGGVSIQRQLKELYGGRSTQPDATNGHLTGVYCDPRDFGSVGVWDQTGVTGISAVFQAALAQSITDNVQLRIPKGLYLVDTPIDLGVNLYDGPDVCGMSGPAIASTGFSLGNHGPEVIFYSAAVDKPAFYNSHAVRGMSLQNFQILGPNIISQFQAPNDFKQNYNLNQGMRDTQYSPLCGLAIDSFNVATPSDGGYPGMTAKYLGPANGSSGLYMRNVNIAGFIVGMGNALSGNGNQGDTWYMHNCSIILCDSCIAIGGAQSKDAFFMEGGLGSSRQAFDGVNYGAGQGWPMVLFGTNLGYLQRIVNYQHGFGPMMLMPNYCESVRSIGNYGSGGSSSRGHATISMGQFTLDNSSSAPPACMYETYGTTTFRDTNFGGAGGGPAIYTWNFGNDIGVPIKFDTCTFAGPGSSVPAFVALQGAFSGGSQGCVATFDTCLMNSGSPAQPWCDFSAADISAFTKNNRFIGSVRSQRYANGTGTVNFTPMNTTGAFIHNCSAITLVTRSVTFVGTLAIGAVQGTLSSAWTDVSGWYMTTFPNSDVRAVNYTNGQTLCKWGGYGVSTAMTGPTATAAMVALTFTATDSTIPQVGDILLWWMVKQYTTSTKRGYPVWRITNVAGSAVTAQPIADTTTFDIVANQPSTTAVIILQQPWAPSGSALTCTTDGTTAVLTAVTPTTILANGDWVQGAGIAANSRVVSGGGTGTVTLNKNTTAAASGVALFQGRLQTPTVTATW